MLFSSLEFLYLFLPLTLVLYFLTPKSWRNGVLLAVSLIFYGSGEPVYIFLMIATIGIDYLLGLGIAVRVRQKRNARPFLVFAVAVNLLLLGFFKYYNFFAEMLFLPTLGITLPIGISFYTFQSLSYVIDVYRREVEAQRDPIAFGTYVALFPQLVAGPIVRYREIDGQLREREHSMEKAAEGIALFCVGLSKKVLLANLAGELWEGMISEVGGVSVLGVWLRLVLYAFQIYFDFSGYSDMAVGLGKLFGFDFPENFRYPYISRSITEFWRRWHITLSSWFREYVYIPLGGNRKGAWRTYRNLLITWALTGIWHGAAWNFLLWGVYFFLLLSLEKAFLKKALERIPAWIGHFYALFFILIGWLIFSSDGVGSLGEFFTLTGQLFGIGCDCLADGWILYELLRNLPMLTIMIIGATPLPKKLYEETRGKYPKATLFIRNILCIAALLLCTAYLVDSGYNPFLYFRF